MLYLTSPSYKSSSIGANFFVISDNLSKGLGTKNAWGVLFKVSQFCSCFTETQHVGYHSSWFFMSISKKTFIFKDIGKIFYKRFIKFATKRPLSDISELRASFVAAIRAKSKLRLAETVVRILSVRWRH